MDQTYQSALEEKFPHIADKICRAWGRPELDQLVGQLSFDVRGDRAGFPADVMSELLFLGLLHGLAYPVRRDKKYSNRGGAFDLDHDPYW
jgi:hypothetical protein